jgi:hypothetical protein
MATSLIRDLMHMGGASYEPVLTERTRALGNSEPQNRFVCKYQVREGAAVYCMKKMARFCAVMLRARIAPENGRSRQPRQSSVSVQFDHAPPAFAGESSTNSANRAPLARSSFSVRSSLSCREIRSFGGAYSEVVACPREPCFRPLDTAQIVPRGAERERAEPPPHAPSLPPACGCGPIPCSHA